MVKNSISLTKASILMNMPLCHGVNSVLLIKDSKQLRMKLNYETNGGEPRSGDFETRPGKSLTDVSISICPPSPSLFPHSSPISFVFSHFGPTFQDCFLRASQS